MKKILKTLIVATALLSLPLIGLSQPGDPPNGGPGGGEPPVGGAGGNAPIGAGVVILSSLAISYGGRKVYKLLKEEE